MRKRAGVSTSRIFLSDMNNNRFTNHTDTEVFDAYRTQCENVGWTSSRATYLSELHEELERRFDCSDIIKGDAMSLRTKNVALVNNKIVLT